MEWYHIGDTAFLLLYAIFAVLIKRSDGFILFGAMFTAMLYAYSSAFDVMPAWANHATFAAIYTVFAIFIKSPALIKSVFPLVCLHVAMAYNYSFARNTALDIYWAECWIVANTLIVSVLALQWVIFNRLRRESRTARALTT